MLQQDKSRKIPFQETHSRTWAPPMPPHDAHVGTAASAVRRPRCIGPPPSAADVQRCIRRRTPQPQGGERMQPTAQAVGFANSSPGVATETITPASWERHVCPQVQKDNPCRNQGDGRGFGRKHQSGTRAQPPREPAGVRADASSARRPEVSSRSAFLTYGIPAITNGEI
jgi:hypothetical protein